MKHWALTPIQKEWLGWILTDYKHWLKGRVDAESNHQKLNWSHMTGLYDITTRQLLNYMLKEFNADIVAKNRFKIHNMWKIKMDGNLTKQ